MTTSINALVQNFQIDRHFINQMIPRRSEYKISEILRDMGCSEKLIKQAEKEAAEGYLMSPSGAMNLTTVQKKVMLFLGHELYKQVAYLLHNVHSEEDLRKFTEERQTPISIVIKGNKKLLNPYIRFTLSDATRWIKGNNIASNRFHIEKVIDELSRPLVYYKSRDGKTYTKTQILQIDELEIDEVTQQKIYTIKLSRLFFSTLMSEYVTFSESTQFLLPELTKEIEINLFLYLIEKLSMKHLPSYPIIRESKQVFEERVVPEVYIKGSRKKKLNEEFSSAIKKMADSKILCNFKREIGKDGKTEYYIFTLNPDWTQTSSLIDIDSPVIP